MRLVLVTLPASMRVWPPSIRPAFDSAPDTLRVLSRAATISPPARLVRLPAVMVRSCAEWILPVLSSAPAASSSDVPAAMAPASLTRLLTARLALASEDTLPRALFSTPVATPRVWPAPMRPAWLSMAPAFSVTSPPITPSGPLAPSASVSRLTSAAAARSSAPSAWIRPAALSSVPRVRRVRPAAAIRPPVLARLCAWMPAAPCAATVPPVLSAWPATFTSSAPPLTSLPAWFSRLAALMLTLSSADPPYKPPS
ncbi:hypothetical protein D9M72_155240 [compost metagenome]